MPLELHSGDYVVVEPPTQGELLKTLTDNANLTRQVINLDVETRTHSSQDELAARRVKTDQSLAHICFVIESVHRQQAPSQTPFILGHLDGDEFTALRLEVINSDTEIANDDRPLRLSVARPI